MELQNAINWLSSQISLEGAAAILIGILLGYALGRFFSESFGEQARFNYLTAKRKVR